ELPDLVRVRAARVELEVAAVLGVRFLRATLARGDEAEDEVRARVVLILLERLLGFLAGGRVVAELVERMRETRARVVVLRVDAEDLLERLLRRGIAVLLQRGHPFVEVLARLRGLQRLDLCGGGDAGGRGRCRRRGEGRAARGSGGRRRLLLRDRRPR